MEITVVDSIMGSGKSTWARKYMNDHPEKSWWYVTPYITEVDKTVDLCSGINMKKPEENSVRHGSSKMDHLLRLIDEGANIASTHALFLQLQLTPELMEKIQNCHYHLIIDEALPVVDPRSITKDDIRGLVASGVFEVDPVDGHIIWKDYDYRGSADGLIPLTKTGTIYHPNENANALVWIYNPDVFRSFQLIYVMTYNFSGSRMYYYFTWLGFPMSFFQTDGENLLVHNDRIMEIKDEIRTLIQVEDSNLNDVGSSGRYASKKLSKNWYDQRKNDESINQLFRNAYNFLHNKCHATVNETLYTTYKSIAVNNPLRGYKKAYLSCTTMATNEFRDRQYLAYLVNIFENPAVTQFFKERADLKYDEESYALNSMLQWIWRTRIRNNESIRVYIPSGRMRGLLENWFVLGE